MAKYKEKEQAYVLRRKGKSLGDIAKMLHVSKGTVSLWCKDIPLTKSQRAFLEKQTLERTGRGRLMGARANKEKKLQLLHRLKEEARRVLKDISQRDLLMLGLGLYWGEGSKSDDPKFVFTNSDCSSIRLVMKWLVDSLGVRREDLLPTIYINSSHEDRIEEVRVYWEKSLKLPRERFGKPVLIRLPQKKWYPNRGTYFGMLRLTIRKGSQTKYRTLAYLDQLRASVDF